MFFESNGTSKEEGMVAAAGYMGRGVWMIASHTGLMACLRGPGVFWIPVLVPGMLSSLMAVVQDCIDGMRGYCGEVEAYV